MLFFQGFIGVFLLSLASAAELCTAPGMARYMVTFTAEWSKARFPKMYPLRRPYGPASWSKMIGRSHGDSYSLFSLDTFASPGVRQYAQTGGTAILDQEPQGAKGILDVFTGPRIPQGTGEDRTTFFVDNKHSEVSLMVRMIPSPDWFIGVDSLNLCDGSTWKTRESIDVRPIDAGADKGLTFTSPNWKSNEKIYQITNTKPNHNASPFYYPNLDELPRIGKLTFERVRLTDDDDHEFPESFDLTSNDVIEPDKPGATPLDCKVSEWSKWGPCGDECLFGKEARFRVIEQEPMNGGEPCPDLMEEVA